MPKRQRRRLHDQEAKQDPARTDRVGQDVRIDGPAGARVVAKRLRQALDHAAGALSLCNGTAADCCIYGRSVGSIHLLHLVNLCIAFWSSSRAQSAPEIWQRIGRAGVAERATTHPAVFRIFACPVTLKPNVCAASTSTHPFPIIRPARVSVGYGL